MPSALQHVLEGAEGGGVSSTRGGTLEKFSNTRQGEPTSDPANPSGDAQRAAHLAAGLSEQLPQPLEHCFTQYLRAKLAKPDFLKIHFPMYIL